MAYRFACISASNVENARPFSASTRSCELIRDLLQEQLPGQVEVDIIPLVDFALNPCCMCGNCYVTGECERDPAFNAIFARLRAADGIFLVCPHYAPFPSKLMMLLEKLEEIAYLNACANPEYRFVLSGKPVGLVAHGGQDDQSLSYYRKALLEPLAAVFGSLRMPVVDPDQDSPHGVVYGIRSITAQTDTVFVRLEHDWPAIRARLAPLVAEMVKAVS